MTDADAAAAAWAVAFGGLDLGSVVVVGDPPNPFDSMTPREARAAFAAAAGGDAWRLRYRQYLRSALWRRRTAALRRGPCAVCPRPAHDVHHKTYARVGDEAPDDLVALCRDHHTLLHAAPPSWSSQPGGEPPGEG